MKWDLSLLWRGFITAVVLTVLLGIIGSILGGVWWLSLIFIGLGVGWWYSNQHQQFKEIIELHENTAFALMLAVLAYAAYKGAPPILLLLAGLTTLIAWDLDGFYRQLNKATLLMGEALIVKAHMQQLALVVGLSLTAGIAVLLFRIHFGFAVGILLAFLAVWGVGLILGQVAEKK